MLVGEDCTVRCHGFGLLDSTGQVGAGSELWYEKVRSFGGRKRALLHLILRQTICATTIHVSDIDSGKLWRSIIAFKMLEKEGQNNVI